MKSKLKTRNTLLFLSFVLPAAIYMILMVIFPIIYNIAISFRDINLMNFAQGGSSFVGTEVYKTIFKDPLLWISMKNTLVFTIWCLIFQFPIGFAMAMLFSRHFPGAPSLRGINFIPWMIPMVAVAGIFKYMFNADIGIINRMLMGLHLIQEPIQWLAYGNTAMAAVIIANVWKGVPFNMILLATALTTLPEDIYEAAIIDGATPVQRFFKITVPLLKPAMLSVLTLGFIYTFKVFDLIYVMTSGGPGSSTEVLSSLAYRFSFSEYNFSKGAAVANILFILLMIVGLFYIYLVNKEDKESKGGRR